MDDLYDACIIGSGAAGGVAAHVLTAGGARVHLLEAGPPVDPLLDFPQHMWPYEFPRRGGGIAREHDGLMAANGFWGIAGEPYTCEEGSCFLWFRSRVLGGRTNHWGQGAVRFEDRDFRSSVFDGVGDDWPIGYADLEPYYDKVELDIGVYGSPRFPNLLPAPPPRCTEVVIAKACRSLGLECTVPPGSILTRPYRGRPACHFCGQCWRGCRDGANYSSSQVHIPLAMQTGRLTLSTNSMVRRILVDSAGRASGAVYIDRITKSERSTRAKAVVLAASACESARLLMNSECPLFPQGLANSSGVVGRFLRDSVVSYGTSYFPMFEMRPAHNHDGVGRPHLWVPKGKLPGDDGTAVKNFHMLFVGGRNMPSLSDFDFVCQREQGYGRALKTSCRRAYGATLNFVAAGEMIPNNSRCTIDPDIRDEWGIPVLRFEFAWVPEEYRLAQTMQSTMRAVTEAAGGTYLTTTPPNGVRAHGISIGGMGFHEQGTVRMGHSPETSAVNGFCQSHEVPKLFVVDAATFVTGSDKPPTLTIMALAWRASEFVLEQLRTGHL